jgi:acetyltransferase-like isoleucine patch superfamily enzyme
MSRSSNQTSLDPRGAALAVAQRSVHGTATQLRRARLVWLVRTAQLRARWRGARLRCQAGPDVRVGRRVRLVVEPRTDNTIELGAGCRIGDDVRIELGDGRLVLGDGVDLRARCTLFVHGRLELAGANVIQHGCTFHCDESISLGRRASLGDYSTVVDSSHTFDGPSDWFGDNLRTAPVVIGADAWLGVKATVTRGVTIGPAAVVGANSVVVADVPPGMLASGVPAQTIRPFSRSRADAGLTGAPGDAGQPASSSS